MKTIAQAKDEIAGLLQTTNLDTVTNLNGAMERATRTMLQTISIPEASGRQNISLYNGVYDYPAPSTIFGGTLTDLRPQGVSRVPSDYVYKQYIEQFDRTKAILPNGYRVTFEWNMGVPIMRVSQNKAMQAILLDPMNATTGWVAGGTASALAEDSTFYYQSPAALRFTLTGSGTGYIEKTLSYGQDLTTYINTGVAFLAIELPSTANITDIKLRIGSDNANYYEITETQGFLGSFISGKFLLVAFNLAGITPTGSPVITAMKYVRVSFDHTATMTNVYTGNLSIALPSAHELIFASNAIFLTGNPATISKTIETEDDQIILSEPAYNIWIHECSSTIAFQNGGTFGAGVVGSINQELHGIRAPRTGVLLQPGLYQLFMAKNPSEEIVTIGNWYND